MASCRSSSLNSACSQTSTNGYFTLDGRTQLEAGAPIQPLFFTDVAAPAAGQLHGALLRSATYNDRPNFDPAIARPINEDYSPAEPTFTADGWYPAVPFGVRGNDGAADRETLVVPLGQYRSDDRTERLYDRLAFDLFYSNSEDRLPPTISRVSASATGGAVRVKVAADDPTGIHRVAVAYTAGGGTWSSVDLTYDGVMRKWVGAVPASAMWFVQAVDAAGNVAIADNKGSYFTARWGGEGRVYLPTMLKTRSQ